jgi:hypothetical protein
MESKTKEQLVSELKHLGLILLVMFIFFKLHYNKESIGVLVKLALAHFFLFIVPGYCLMLYYFERLDFFERFFIGLGLGYGVQPLILYTINVIIEVNILQYNKIVSIGMIILGIGLFYVRNKEH